MEEKEKGRGRSAREKDGTGKEGGLRVTARRPRALFIPSSRAREACEHKGCFRGKKQFQYLAQKNFFFFSSPGISILEYVLGTSRMGINWKTSYPRWKIIFMKLSRG